MTTAELFKKISTTPEFKAHDQARLWKHRHNKGILSSDTYCKIFSQFGYEIRWSKKNASR